mmetsp:Transcript_39470/g.51672  ORF Transcript_39470/g.51672 Transcript_39470/m.51672 type:complete len:102 (-) Transcript_39470:652-957(-)
MRHTLQLGHVLLVKVSLNGHQTAWTLLKVDFFGTLVQLVLRVARHLDNLGAPNTISEHLALEDVVQIHFVSVQKIRGRGPAKLARSIPFFFFYNTTDASLL